MPQDQVQFSDYIKYTEGFLIWLVQPHGKKCIVLIVLRSEMSGETDIPHWRSKSK